MTPLPLRILLNAEPFGFGPSAAIAEFFPHLVGKFDKIGYIGKKHTLDLQRGLDYDAIHDVSSITREDRAESYEPIFSDYDILVTAMDYKMAEFAQDNGLKVFYYDALAWYWPDIPASVKKCDLYLAQDFFGVEDRVALEFGNHSNAKLVPPIISKQNGYHQKTNVLINLGGLQNPYWPLDQITDYAKQIIGVLKQSIPETEDIIIASSNLVADRLKDYGVNTYERKEMKEILSHCKLAYMTPGLGNIYDAASYKIPTIWLPPANDSQGRQLDLLQEQNMVDYTLGWNDILCIPPINYKNEQIDTLNQIANMSAELSKNEYAQNNLLMLARNAYKSVSNQSKCKATGLIDTFGANGEKIVCQHIINQAKSYITIGGPS